MTRSGGRRQDKTGIVLENKPHSKVLIRVDGSRRVTMRNWRFVRRLDPTLRKTECLRTVMREHVKKPPPAQKEHVREASPVRHDVPVEGHAIQEGGHQERGELQGRHDVADGAAVPLQDGDVAGAVHVPVEKGPDELVGDAPGEGHARPRRSPKPSPKYNPVFDLNYVGVRKRSMKSIRRAGR